MTTETEILFRLEADATGAVRGFVVSKNELEKLRNTAGAAGGKFEESSKKAGKLGTETEKLGQKSGAAETAVRRLKQVVGGLITVAALKQVTSYADQMKNLDARLRIVTDTERELTRAREETFAISQRTSTALQSTVELYTRLELALKDANVAQDDVLRVTETINQAMQASGASAAEATAAIIQLSQGLAAGALRGDEFRSVAEQSPRILQALQEALGKTRGELKALADDGKLTTEIVVTALLDQSATIEKEFGELPITVGRAFTQLRNNLLAYIGDIDGASGASARFAGLIVALSDNLQTILTLALSVATGALVAYIAKATLALNATKLLALAAAVTNPYILLAGAVAGVTFAVVEWRARQGEMNEILDTSSEAVKRYSDAIAKANTIRALSVVMDESAQAVERLRDRLEEANEELAIAERSRGNKGRVYALKQEIEQLNAAIEVQLARFNEAREKNIALMQATDDQSEATETLEERLRALIAGLDATSDAETKLEAAIKAANKAIESHGTQQAKIAAVGREYAAIVTELREQLQGSAEDRELLAQAEEALTAQLEEAIEAILDETDAARILENELLALEQQTIDTAEQGFMLLELRLEELIATGEVTAEQAAELRERILELRLAAEEVAEKAPPAIDHFAKAVERGVERLDDAFANMWSELLRGGENALDALKDLFFRTLGELIHAATTRPIVVRIAAAGGLTGPGQLAAGQQTGSSADLLGDLASLFTGNSIGTAFAGLGQFLPQWGSSSSAALTGLYGPTPSGGNLAGNIFGSAGQIPNWAYAAYGLGGAALGNWIAPNSYAGAGGGLGASLGAAWGVGQFAAYGSAAGPIGAAIGAAIGIAIGAFFKTRTFQATLGGALAEGASGGVQRFETPLSTVVGIHGSGGFGDLNDPNTPGGQIGQAIRAFDQAMFELVSTVGGDEQLDEIRSALDRWRGHWAETELTVENVLGSRFDVILETFSENVQGYVAEFEGLENRLEALGDATTVEQLIEVFPDLFESFDQAVFVLKDLQESGEAIGNTIGRVVAGVEILDNALAVMGKTLDLGREEYIRFSEAFVDAAGGIQTAAALWDGFFQLFGADNSVIASAPLRIARDVASRELGDIGLSPTISKDEFARLFDEILPTLSAEALVEWLEAANALGVVVQLENELNAARLDGLSLTEALIVQTEYVRELREEFDGSAFAIRDLTDAAAQLGLIIEQVEAQFDAARDQVGAITGDLITELRRETMTDEDIYNEIRSQALTRAGDLATASSREEVVAIVSEITSLTRDARALLPDAELNDELITFLEGINATATTRLAELEDQELARARAELEQTEAMLSFAEAVADFRAAVDTLNSGDIAFDPNLAGDAGASQTPGEVAAGPSGAEVAEVIAAFDADGLRASVGDFGAAVGAFADAAARINTRPPDVQVQVNIEIDEFGNARQTNEVGLI